MRDAERILVLGLAGRYAMAGVAWQAIHYLVGLERLGYEVYYAEDSGAPPYSPRRQSISESCEENVAFLASMMSSIGLGDRWVYWDSLEDRHHGLGRSALRDLYASSRSIWNLCGASRPGAEHRRGATLVYVQTDPVVEQVLDAKGDAHVRATLDAHDVLFTYGENLGSPVCPIPIAGRMWHATRPPVVLDLWTAAPPSPTSRFSTVATWENRGKDVSWQGTTYHWSKHENFVAFMEVPRRAGLEVHAAMEPPDALAERFAASGWTLSDPRDVSLELAAYRDFIVGSRGELTVAKDVYVRSRSGWFSDRSACYLAAGRPVVTQDTGFGAHISTGRGLLAFSTPDEACRALLEVESDLEGHARAARQIAQDHFAAEKVLGAMLETIERAAT